MVLPSLLVARICHAHHELALTRVHILLLSFTLLLTLAALIIRPILHQVMSSSLGRSGSVLGACWLVCAAASLGCTYTCAVRIETPMTGLIAKSIPIGAPCNAPYLLRTHWVRIEGIALQEA